MKLRRASERLGFHQRPVPGHSSESSESHLHSARESESDREGHPMASSAKYILPGGVVDEGPTSPSSSSSSSAASSPTSRGQGGNLGDALHATPRSPSAVATNSNAPQAPIVSPTAASARGGAGTTEVGVGLIAASPKSTNTPVVLPVVDPDVIQVSRPSVVVVAAAHQPDSSSANSSSHTHATAAPKLMHGASHSTIVTPITFSNPAAAAAASVAASSGGARAAMQPRSTTPQSTSGSSFSSSSMSRGGGAPYHRDEREASNSTAAGGAVAPTKTTNKLMAAQPRLSIEMSDRTNNNTNAADDLKQTQGGGGGGDREGTTLKHQSSDASLIRIHPSSGRGHRDDGGGGEDQEEESTVVVASGLTTSTLVVSPSMATTIVDQQQQDLVEVLTEVPVPPGFIHPNSPFLLWWSYTLMAVALYNAFTVPYRWTFWSSPVVLSWDVILLLIIDAVGDLFFLGEIAKNLRVGFYEDGKLVFDPRLIRRRYFRSWWFVLDIITCLPFDLIQVAEMTILPPVRILKVLRIFQLWHHINLVEQSRSVSLTFKLAKLFFYTCIIAHVAACIKYPIIIKNPQLAPLFASHIEFERYLLTLYWGLGNLIDRGDSNSPYGAGDYFLSVATMFVGVIWVSNFVAAMDQYTDSADATKKRHLEEYKQVKMFMSKFNLPSGLQTQVKAYYSYLWGSPARYDLTSTLEKLSTTLRADAIVAMNSCIAGSPLFEGLSHGFLAHLLASVRRQISLPQEILCRAGMLGMEIYFIEDGLVEVLIGPNQSVISSLRVGEHFGEFSVLLGTFRTATVRSVSYCTMLVVDKKDLQDSFETFPHAEALVTSNAQKMKQRADLQEKSFMAMHATSLPGGSGGPSLTRSKLQQLMAKQQEEDELAAAQTQAKPRWTISHQETWYVAWESCHIGFVLYNSLMTPVMIAFAAHTTNPIILAMNYIGDAVMIADICLCFRVRYVHNGSEVSDLQKIRENYIQSRFRLHVLASLPLDFAMIATGMQPYLRLNRILRVADVHELINARIRDSKLPDVFALLYLCVNLLFISHWFACIYWVLSSQAGFLTDPNAQGWQPTQDAADQGSSLLDYLRALYWSLGLLVGYGSAFYPPNYYATIFTLVIQLTGLFIISYLIGVLGNTAGTLQIAAAAATEEVDVLTEAAKFSRWSDELVKRCSTFLKHSWDMQKGIDPNLALLRLPVLLRTEIMSTICGPLIRSVRRLSSLDEACLRTLVAELRFEEFPRGEYVFRQGYEGSEMYFIAKGLCDILVDNGAQEVTLKTIGPSCFFGEGALFSGLRSASVRCTSSVLLYSLSSVAFLQVMHAHPEFASSLLSAHQSRHEKLREVKMQAGVAAGAMTPAATSRKHRSGLMDVTMLASPSGPHVEGATSPRTPQHAELQSPSGFGAAESDGATGGGGQQVHQTKLAAAVAHMLERYNNNHQMQAPRGGGGGTTGSSPRPSGGGGGGGGSASVPFMAGLGGPDISGTVTRAMTLFKAKSMHQQTTTTTTTAQVELAQPTPTQQQQPQPPSAGPTTGPTATQLHSRRTPSPRT